MFASYLLSYFTVVITVGKVYLISTEGDFVVDNFVMFSKTNISNIHNLNLKNYVSKVSGKPLVVIVI